MFECERAKHRCSAHKASRDRIRAVYIDTIESNYTRRELKGIRILTDQIMLEVTCESCVELDDQNTDTLDLACENGLKYAEAAKRYIEMLYDNS